MSRARSPYFIELVLIWRMSFLQLGDIVMGPCALKSQHVSIGPGIKPYSNAPPPHEQLSGAYNRPNKQFILYIPALSGSLCERWVENLLDPFFKPLVFRLTSSRCKADRAMRLTEHRVGEPMATSASEHVSATSPPTSPKDVRGSRVRKC